MARKNQRNLQKNQHKDSKESEESSDDQKRLKSNKSTKSQKLNKSSQNSLEEKDLLSKKNKLNHTMEQSSTGRVTRSSSRTQVSDDRAKNKYIEEEDDEEFENIIEEVADSDIEQQVILARGRRKLPLKKKAPPKRNTSTRGRQNKGRKKDDEEEDYNEENDEEEEESESSSYSEEDFQQKSNKNQQKNIKRKKSDSSHENSEEEDEIEELPKQTRGTQRNLRSTRTKQKSASEGSDNESISNNNEEGNEEENKSKGAGKDMCCRYRRPDELLSIFSKMKEKRDSKQSSNNSEDKSQDIDSTNFSESKQGCKRKREEFEKEQESEFLEMPDLKKEEWPKYIGSLQFKSKVQFEFFGYLRKVEFIMLKRWANKHAESLHRGQVLQVDFRKIDESKGKQRTLSLQASRLHTNISNVNKENFGIFEHDGCEIWNFLAFKNYVTLKLFCINPLDDSNEIDGNKAFDVLMDVYLNKEFFDDPLALSFLSENENDESDEELEEEEDEPKKKQKNNKKNDQDEKEVEKKKEKKNKKKLLVNMNEKEKILEWEFDLLRHMKEVIPTFLDLMKLKKTIPALIQQKKANQYKLMKRLAFKRHHSTLPVQLVLKSEYMRDYYSHCPEDLERASPLYLLLEEDKESLAMKNKSERKNVKAIAKKRKSKNSKRKEIEEEDEDIEEDISENEDFIENKKDLFESNYGRINENTKESLGLIEPQKEKEELTEEESIKLNDQLCNVQEFKFYWQEPTPKNMCTQLFDYQKQGLSWLLYREGRLSKKDLFKLHPEHFSEDRELNPFYEEITLPDTSKFYHNVFSAEISPSFVPAKHTFGGILADQMGMGKTLMSLALIHSDLETPRKQKIQGTLLVMPLTCLSQWQREIIKHSYNDTIKVLNYHEKQNREAELSEFDVVLCPYNLLTQEFTENSKGKLFQSKWHRVILDEAQKIKNFKSSLAEASFKLQAEFRWVLTGTPIENKLDDLFSLLRFLRVETFGEWFWWNSYINQQASTADKFDLLHQVLKPLILRRTKLSKDKEGKEILELPKKNIHLDFVKLNQNEQKLYNLLHSGSKSVLDEITGNKEVQGGKNYMHIFQLICKLRQFCVHPSLVFQGVDSSKLNDITLLKAKIEMFLDKYRQIVQVKEDDDEFIIPSSKKSQSISQEYRNELIQNIKIGEYKTCLVCFDEIQVHSLSVCGHILCNQCFSQSVKIHKSCPICRHPLTEIDICDIFMQQLHQKQ